MFDFLFTDPSVVNSANILIGFTSLVKAYLTITVFGLLTRTNIFRKTLMVPLLTSSLTIIVSNGLPYVRDSHMNSASTTFISPTF